MMRLKGNRQVLLNRITGIIGGILAFSGVILLSIAPEFMLVITGIEIAALALLAFFFFGHFELIKTFSLKRSTRLGANSLLMVLLFLVMLGILNFILSRHSKRFDFSETGKFSLAPQTLKVLENLNHEVKVTGFFQEGGRPRQEFKDLVEGYRNHSNKLNYEFIDPDRKPAIAKQYGINQYNTVVLEGGKQETRIKAAADVVSEEELTNALIRVSREQRKVVYFLEGHGEHALDDPGQTGYSQVKETLEREGLEVKTLSILKEGKIPQDATVLVLAGPQRLFLGAEKDAIRRYLQDKGQIFLLLDPQEKTGLDDLLAEWGLTLGHEIILDPSPNLTLLGFDASNALVLNYTPHDIVKDLRLA
ncbi:MAG: GldG family protein, partial [Nitrospira sp.]|nr:GldG family protein [Nitrospira sp.]